MSGSKYQTQLVGKEVTITKVIVNYNNNGFAKKGTINHANFIESLRNFELSQVKKANGTDDEVTSDDFYVIPQALTAVDGGIKVTFTANYKQGSSIVSTQNVDLYLNKDSHTSWTPGYSYVYTIGLPQSATPIVFGTPSVTTWADGGTITLQ